MLKVTKTVCSASKFHGTPYLIRLDSGKSILENFDSCNHDKKVDLSRIQNSKHRLAFTGHLSLWTAGIAMTWLPFE